MGPEFRKIILIITKYNILERIHRFIRSAGGWNTTINKTLGVQKFIGQIEYRSFA